MATAVEYLSDIIEKATQIVQETTTSDEEFDILIEQAQERESSFYNNIDPNLIDKDGEINLDAIVQRIDAEYGFSELLPSRGIERYLTNLGYNLSGATTKNEASPIATLTEDEQQMALEYLQTHIINKAGNEIMVASTKNATITSKILGDVVDLIRDSLYSSGVTSGLNSRDLGQITGKINSKFLSIQKAKIPIDRRHGHELVKVELNKIELTSTGIFNNMDTISQQILFNLANNTLSEYVNSRNNAKNISLTEVPEDQLRYDVLQALSSTCPSGLDAFYSSAGDFTKRLASISGDISNLRGFLGEIRVVGILSKIFPQINGQTLLNGLEKVDIGTSKGKESPIDAILYIFGEEYGEFGFQSKNTSSNIYTWGSLKDEDSVPVPAFYSQKIAEALTEAESNFFRAYDFNEPIPDATEEYRDEYARFNEVFNSSFVAKYTSLAFRIIRQQIEDNNGRILRNDFFFMNNRVIPSSKILYNMKIAMHQSNPYLTSSFMWTKNGPNWRPGQEYVGGGVGSVNIGYKVNLNINKLAGSSLN